MISVSKEAVCLGRDLSCDEQTIGFQGNHKDKQRITYKKEGDGQSPFIENGGQQLQDEYCFRTERKSLWYYIIAFSGRCLFLRVLRCVERQA